MPIGHSKTKWQCKWHNLVANFGTNASDVTWWPNFEPNLQPIRKCIFKWNTNLILKHCQRHAGTKGIESLTWISFRTEFAFFLDEEISQVLDSVPWLFYVGNYNSTDRCDWEKFERRLGSAPEDYPLPLGGASPPPWTKWTSKGHGCAPTCVRLVSGISQNQHQPESISNNQHQSASKILKSWKCNNFKLFSGT